MSEILNACNLIVGVAILYLVVCACNAMSKCTRRAIVTAYIMLGVGAMGSGLAPYFGLGNITEPELIGNCGVVLLLYATRRKAVLIHARGISVRIK